MRESRVAASIDHPNVIPVYYAGERTTARCTSRCATSRARTCARSCAPSGRLDPARAAHIVAQVAAALDAAHARGLVHRDVKPANVLLGADEHVYLTDFGLTKRVTSTAASTRAGGWVGTLDYVAPEQIRGERVDARADVYALGCVLYYALTGTPPYDRDSDEATLWAHLNDDPPTRRPSARRARGFDDVVARALAKEPDDRFPSAGDLGRAALAAAGEPVRRAPERLVAVGEAAPGDRRGDGGRARPAPTELAASDSRTRRLRRGPSPWCRSPAWR